MAEVEATLQRLTSHRSVKGVLVLSNETGRVIRWTGQILEGPTTGSKASSAVEDGDNEEATESSKGVRSAEISEPAKRYAALVRRIVGSAKDEVVNVDKEDSVRFMRIRTKKYELMITPEDKYTLVVFHDFNPS